jgi:hypothetical protein
MRAVYGYDKNTSKFNMEWDGKDYQFTFNLDVSSVAITWDAQGKVIAKSYKGLRARLGVTPASRDSQELVNLFKSCRNFLAA